ncbi:methionyl-tRNA formyltransferase [Rickettsia endosymbiont of Halotydeus destructor]|uniref:methionyl-tRNA formyltransferase n=1 Tax=Rickettsia endosymbiont of Halotydeus destructor TaxID=2996754 RepID=UPI003BB023B9
MKIIFMGTPGFALPTLEKLIVSNNHQVVSVFTQKPKAKGRGLHEAKSPVHQLALQNKIPVYTPSTLKSTEVTDLINSIEADIIVVVAYGFIVPPAILQAKKYGCLNIHPSDLPKHRGAAPLQRTIIGGDKTSAVCVMRMDAGLDTGDILIKQNFDIPVRVTLEEFHNKCADMGAELLIKALDKIDHLTPTPQRNEEVSYAHKLTKEEGKINWHDAAYQIDCKVRAMNPWPGVYFSYKDKIIKVLEADYLDHFDGSFLPGTVINNKLEIACGSGILIIKKLQQEGRKPLTTEEFLRGVDIAAGTVLN